MLLGMRSQVTVVAAIALLLMASCDKKPSHDPAPKAEKDAAPAPTASKLGDLSSSLAAAREAFNAHKGEARFLTLLSPT